MPDPSRLRDSTQIVVPAASLDGVRAALEREFTVTVLDGGGKARIIGSPVVIQRVSEFLLRRGVVLS